MAEPGIAPPIPKPVKKRHTLTVKSEPAKAVNTEARPKIVRLASKSGFLPMWSPIGPEDKAPTRMPMLDHRNAAVKAGPGRFQAWVNCGTATPIELMS